MTEKPEQLSFNFGSSEEELQRTIYETLRKRNDLGMNLRTILRDSSVIQIQGDVIRIRVPNELLAQVVYNGSSKQIIEAAKLAGIENPNVQAVIDETISQLPIKEQTTSQRDSKTDSSKRNYSPLSRGAEINPLHNFERLCVVDSNKHVVSLIRTALDSNSLFHSLFLVGQAGTGKTAFAQAACNLSQAPYYTTATGFSQTMRLPIFNREQNGLDKHKYHMGEIIENSDIFVVDQIEGLRGEATQNFFQELFDRLVAKKTPVIAISEYELSSPQFNHLHPSLKSRLEQMLRVGMNFPEQEEVKKIIRAMLKEKSGDKLSIGEGVVEEISSIILSQQRTEGIKNLDYRRIEGRVLTTVGYSMGNNLTYLSPEIVRTALTRQVYPTTQEETSGSAVIREYATRFEISPSDIKGRGRSGNKPLHKGVCAYILRNTTDLTLVAIAQELGEKDHGSVLHQIKIAERRMSEDSEFKERVAGLVEHFKKK